MRVTMNPSTDRGELGCREVVCKGSGTQSQGQSRLHGRFFEARQGEETKI